MIIILLLVALLTINESGSGYATNYWGNTGSNACGMYDGTADAFGDWAFTAIGGDKFDSGYGCGECYTVRCTGAYGNNPSCSCDTSKSLTIQAIDQCGSCTGDHVFDLNDEAFTYFTGSSSMTGICGEVSVEYERIDCSAITTNFKVTNKEGGTSMYWYGFYLEDVNDDGGIKSVQLLKDGSWIATCDKAYGPSYWECTHGSSNSALLNLPLDIKITSDLGKSVTAYNCITSLDSYKEMRCNTNLASGGSSFTYTQDEEDKNILASIIISIVTLLLSCLVIGVFAYCFIKRRKQKLAVSFDNNNENKVKEEEEDGKSAGYDMDPINTTTV